MSQERWIIATAAAKKKTQEQTEEALRFAIDAARLAADTRCDNVAVLDVRGISPVTDFLVLATGTSGRQMRSVTDEVEELGGPRGFKPLSGKPADDDSWILCDFVDVVLHVFSPAARSYYDLDGFWGDAPRVEWERGANHPTR